MLKRYLSIAAMVAMSLFVAGCNSSSSASANSSASKATSDAKDAKDKAEKELREKESADKAKAEKDAKAGDAASKLDAARATETAALVKAKEEMAKVFDLPKVEAVIPTLPADKKAIAQVKLDDFKKLWADFMKEKNADKLNDWKDKLKSSFGEVSKAAGL
ncbi:hypothetical protein BH11PLA2_BH11PLA2_27290 [soil metagenome]